MEQVYQAISFLMTMINSIKSWVWEFRNMHHLLEEYTFIKMVVMFRMCGMLRWSILTKILPYYIARLFQVIAQEVIELWGMTRPWSWVACLTQVVWVGSGSLQTMSLLNIRKELKME